MVLLRDYGSILQRIHGEQTLPPDLALQQVSTDPGSRKGNPVASGSIDVAVANMRRGNAGT